MDKPVQNSTPWILPADTSQLQTMTIRTADPHPHNTAESRVPGPRQRAATWCLHVAVVALAVGSVLTNRFDLWIDLRLLGPAGAYHAIDRRWKPLP